MASRLHCSAVRRKAGWAGWGCDGGFGNAEGVENSESAAFTHGDCVERAKSFGYGRRVYPIDAVSSETCGEACLASGADEVEVEGRIMAVREQGVPYLVTPGNI